MFWKNGSDFIRTTTFRLTLWYLAVFSTLTLTVFLVVYVSLSLRLQGQTDKKLNEKSMEFATLYRDHGLKALHAEFVREAESHGTDHVFFQLISSHEEALASSDSSQWKEIVKYCPKKYIPQNNQQFYQTLSLNGRKHNVRLLSISLDNGERIVVVSSLRPEEIILERYRETFGVAFMVMVGCGSIFGFFLARKAMAGVQRVTDTATSIGRNDLGRRVPLANEGEEINALARAFNAMLERIEALLSEFRHVTDNVAHELRTPITRIRGMAETTLKGGDDLHEYKEMAASVIDGCDGLVEMINTMLDIAKTDSGIVELDQTPIDLTELVSEAIDLFSPLAEDKCINIQWNKPPIAAMVIGDRRRLQRVISNLLDNAIKYTPIGGVLTSTIDVEGGNVYVSISDTGIGINGNDIPHIFERFYRCDHSRSTPGSGLGLSLAQAVIHAHGGEITVESSTCGSTFTFFLPNSSFIKPA
jgi:heavy metal sensor kinase